MDLLGYIKEAENSPEMKRFKTKILFNRHVFLCQDFNGFSTPNIRISRSDDDEYNWLISIQVFFWIIEISWNGRRNKS